jgi:hypothetical protein
MVDEKGERKKDRLQHSVTKQGMSGYDSIGSNPRGIDGLGQYGEMRQVDSPKLRCFQQHGEGLLQD